MSDFEYTGQPGMAGPISSAEPPLDLSHHFSRITKAREESAVKKLYKYFQIPGMVQLAGGLPNPGNFPYDTLEAQVARADRFDPTPNSPSFQSQKPEAAALKDPKSKASAHITVPHVSSQSNPLKQIDLTTALQYGTAQGYPALYYFLRQFTRNHLHPNIPYQGNADIILTNGSTDGFSKAIEAFTNVWSPERDWIREREGILCEEFAYMNAMQTVAPRGVQAVPVKLDLIGMRADGPGGLKDVLENWDESKGKRPHLMYTVTIGQNPTSGTLTLERRKEIYALCSKYDVIIIEDDPYWYLQFPSAALLSAQRRDEPLPSSSTPIHSFKNSSGYAFLDSLEPSYLNIDVDGRVVRLDTFSKTVAPGCRLGWITAQPKIIERIMRITECSTQQPSGFVQSMIAELLMGPDAILEASKKSKKELATFSGWKVDGWVRWLEGLRGEYERRMNIMCDLLEENKYYVKQGTPTMSSDSDWAVITKTHLYTFDWPRGGMFVWVHMFYETHPLFGKVSGLTLAGKLFLFLLSKPYLVMVSPGLAFSPTFEIAAEKGWQYFRLCFAAVEKDELVTASKGFAKGIKAFWMIKDVKDLDKIVDPADDPEDEVLDIGRHNMC